MSESSGRIAGIYRTLGPVGLLGLLVVAAGLGLITWADPVIGGGVALVLAGLGLVVQTMVRKVMKMFGMAP